MDLITHLPEILVALAVAVFFHLRRRLADSQKRLNLVPEIPGALPIIGHLHLLGWNQPFARRLGSMAEKFGDVFTIRLGANSFVVVSDQAAIKECFTTNDRALSARSDSTTHAKIIGYEGALLGFASDTKYVSEMKKILTVEILSVQKIKALRHVRTSEVDFLIRELFQQSKGGGGEAFSISDSLHRYSINIMTRMVAGKRYFDKIQSYDEENSSEGRPIGEVIRDFMLAIGTFVPVDYIPILGRVGSQGPIKAMKRVFKELDDMLEGWIDEHKKKGSADGDPNRDFIDIVLSEIKEEFAYGYKREDIIKALAQALILAGSDTTGITITWVLSNLLNHKEALKLAQEELDNKIGKDRWADDSDVENLTYLKAVMKETLRMYPPGALSMPRLASEDITIKGYHIPKGTQVFANFWKLHRDPKHWSDPTEFKPERFLRDDVDIQPFEYLPFGSGRRGCPGTNFGMQATQLTLARLLQGFYWATPGNQPVDMREGVEFILSKAKPLEVVLTPRLSPQLYEL